MKSLTSTLLGLLVLFCSLTTAAPLRLVGLSNSGLPAALTYQTDSGTAELLVFDTKTKAGKTTWQGEVGKGWTHIMPFRNNSRVFVLLYDTESGKAKHMEVLDKGQSLKLVEAAQWSPGWTSIESFHYDSRNFFVTYNRETGYTKINLIFPDGVSSDEYYSKQWIPGRTDLQPLSVGKEIYFFHYNRDGGKVVVTKLSKNAAPPNYVDTTGVWWGFWAKEDSHFSSVMQEGNSILGRYKYPSNTFQTWQYSADKKEMVNLGSKHLGDIQYDLTMLSVGATPHLLLHTHRGFSLVEISADLATFRQVWESRKEKSQ